MNANDFKYQYGPAAVVTGASSGIGKAFAELLAREGMDLVLVARRRERLEELADRLGRAHGIKVTVCTTDLSRPEAANEILSATASVDVGLVISNAGFGLKGAFTDNDPKKISDMLMVNCHSPMLLARGFIPRLKARGRGGIVFTSSIEGLIGCPYSSAYSATKGLVNNLGEGLWGELTPEGIDVLTLCPGATDTEAPVLQGIDPATLHNLMSPREVAELALANIKHGPVYIPSEHYKTLFEQLLSLPRADALSAMAKNMK